MPISGALYARYTSDYLDVDWRSAVILSHPAAGDYYCIANHEAFLGVVGGDYSPGAQRSAWFNAVEMQVVLPQRDDSGSSDMSIVWDGIGGELATYIANASVDGTQPIKCYFTIYILSSQTPQIAPFMEFNLTGISVTEEQVAATASRADVINKKFPGKVYRLDRFPGLRRR